MIETGLPYSTEDMSKIYSDGAKVDMSNINFPTNESKYRTTFIYLRNTNFNNIELDFSKCNYEDKAKFLIEYIRSDITVELRLFIYTLQCLLTYKNCEPYFSEEEAKRFIEEDGKVVLQELKDFYLSLPVYLFTRLELVEMDMKGLEVRDYTTFGRNTYFLIQNDFIDYLSAQNPDFTSPVLYPKHFTVENNVLFDFMKGLDIYNLIQTMTETDPKEFEQLLTAIKNFEH